MGPGRAETSVSMLYAQCCMGMLGSDLFPLMKESWGIAMAVEEVLWLVGSWFKPY